MRYVLVPMLALSYRYHEYELLMKKLEGTEIAKLLEEFHLIEE